MVWTGSNNFTGGGDKNDEVMMRIAVRHAPTASTVSQFRYIVRRKSSAKYAYFFERAGGGRAPKPHKRLGPTNRRSCRRRFVGTRTAIRRQSTSSWSAAAGHSRAVEVHQKSVPVSLRS